jgi:hypothetical protein
LTLLPDPNILSQPESSQSISTQTATAPNHIRREPLTQTHREDFIEPGTVLGSSLKDRGDAEITFARIERLTLRQPGHKSRRATPHSGVSNVDECAIVRL